MWMQIPPQSSEMPSALLSNNGQATSLTMREPNSHVPHFATIPNGPISSLTPYSGLILAICLVILFGLKIILDHYIFPIIYPCALARMDDEARRSFVNYHIAGGVKVVILFIAAKPVVDIVFGQSALSSPMSRLHPKPTMGDILLVLCHLFSSMYLFELVLRRKPSLITIMHHVGGVMIGQSAIALSVDYEHQPNATVEFVMCLVWGFWDVLAEWSTNVAFVLYRIKGDNHQLLARMFATLTVISVLGTIAETIMVMVLFGLSWSVWEIQFKVLTPLLHTLFMFSQLQSARVLFKMFKKEKQRMHDGDEESIRPAASQTDSEPAIQEKHPVSSSTRVI
ncbi:hypothetical protein BT63DRAFT_444073 [Microthyrium microscopicum]|uniref:TLC domain-containing protein n=1 Tax=Microthyrium microscopicum TaxID=703497 RepID=A0A6A6TW92_9PEZI|nr:hypothetical protein BT63DRAFT_444073 [Microthyrium microscopicum]